MSRAPTDYRSRSERRIRAIVARWLVRPVGIVLLVAGGDSLPAWTRGDQPAQPPTAVTGTSAGAQASAGTQTTTGTRTTTGTAGGRTLAPPRADTNAPSDAPTRPAGTAADADAVEPALFVGPPEPPWLVGPPAPGIEELAEGLYVATGYGGNLVARVTAEGTIIAGELTARADTIAARLAGVTDQPVRYVLRTHRHDEGPADLPVPWRNARLVAPEPSESLASGSGVGEPAEPPDLSFTRGLSLFLGEAEVQLHHFAPAHTAGDAAVLFPDLGVLYAGDLVVRGMPFVDYAAGGSSRGWVESLDGILALDFETAIPGAGPPLTKRDVQVFRDRFVTLRMRATQLLYRNVPPASALPLLQTADLDWPLDPGGEFAARSFAALYDELAVEREEAREAAAAEPDEASEAIARP